MLALKRLNDRSPVLERKEIVAGEFDRSVEFGGRSVFGRELDFSHSQEAKPTRSSMAQPHSRLGPFLSETLPSANLSLVRCPSTT